MPEFFLILLQSPRILILPSIRADGKTLKVEVEANRDMQRVVDIINE